MIPHQSSRFLLFVYALFTLQVLPACVPVPNRQVKLPPPLEINSVGPGDVIEVSVFDEPSLSRTYKLAPDGTVDFHLLGSIEIEGKEPQEIGRILREKLKEKKILKNPSVSVNVKEMISKKISILGQVVKPGQYTMTEGTTIVQAISVAGGFSAIADKERVILVRKVPKGKPIRVVVSVAAIMDARMSDIPLQAGDQITVEQSFL